MTVSALLLTALLFQSSPADEAHREALALLEAGKPLEAEAKAREALASSLRFRPEEEIEVRPDKGLLFDEMILEARTSYRARRARYFRALGDALAAQERFAASRKAYRRAAAMSPGPEIPLLVAEHPDLEMEQRLDLLLEAYLAPGADRPRLEEKLLATGAFRSRDALKASLDRTRFPSFQASHPELELLEGSFPELQAVTNEGTFLSAQLFRTGTTIVVYAPIDGCARCSEELDGLAAPVRTLRARQVPIEVVAFVPERDLPIARRIVRLLGTPVGVGREEGLPEALRFLEGGEIRIVARSGMTQIRIPLTEGLAASDVRRRVDAALSFLTEPGLPTEERPEEASRPLVALEKGPSEPRTFRRWVEKLEALEAGPAPLTDLYAELNRLAQQVVTEQGGRAQALELLREVSRLEGANGVKTRLLGLVGRRVSEALLAEAQSLDSAVRRTPAGERGVLYTAVSKPDVEPARILVQRSFETDEGLRDFDFVLEDDGSSFEIVWSAAAAGAPRGVDLAEDGAVFAFGGAGLRVVSGGRVVFEGERAAVVEGNVVEIRNAIVDEVEPADRAPRFYVPIAADEGESPLERGLRLFAEGDVTSASAAFEEAEAHVDPMAPYDAADLVYNRARALEEQGRRLEALELYRSLGDVAYQDRVDERARLIESGR